MTDVYLLNTWRIDFVLFQHFYGFARFLSGRVDRLAVTYWLRFRLARQLISAACLFLALPSCLPNSSAIGKRFLQSQPRLFLEADIFQLLGNQLRYGAGSFAGGCSARVAEKRR